MIALKLKLSRLNADVQVGLDVGDNCFSFVQGGMGHASGVKLGIFLILDTLRIKALLALD